MTSQDVSPATASPPGYSEDDFRAMLSKIGSLQEENVFINQKLQVRISLFLILWVWIGCFKNFFINKKIHDKTGKSSRGKRFHQSENSG
jgi:hypothetical protein